MSIPRTACVFVRRAVTLVALTLAACQASPQAGEDAGTDADADTDTESDTDTGFVVDESCEIEGATYYLDAVDGDDGGDGSAQAPWRTLAKALAEVSGGDGVVMLDGEYGPFEWTGPGFDDFVTFKAEEGHAPVLTALNVGSAAAEIDARLRFCDLTVQHPEPDPWPADDGLRHSVGNVLSIRGANDVEVIRCTLRGVNKYLSDGVAIQDSDRVVVHGCDVSVVTGGSHAIDCDDLTFTYNHVHGMSEGSGIRFQGDTTGTLIEGNHVHDCNSSEADPYFPSDDPTEWHVGSGISIRVSNARIRNNIVHDGFAQALMFYMDGGIERVYENMVVENNLFYDTQRVALYELAENISVRNNTFVSEVRVDGVDKYDILQRYGGGAYLMMSFADGHDGSTVEVVNNILVGVWSLPDAAAPYVEDYNIFWLREEGEELLSHGKGDNSFMAVWRDGPEDYALRGYPNFFEDIGFTGETPEYSHAEDGVAQFFADPAFYFGEVGGFADNGRTLDFSLVEDSFARNFGDPSRQPSDSLGSLGEDGFIRRDGPARDADHRSAGAYELP